MNNFQEPFPYLNQMNDQFRKIFGDEFVSNLMNSMQSPNWWQHMNTQGPMSGVGQPPPGGDHPGQGQQARPPFQAEPRENAENHEGGWNPFQTAMNSQGRKEFPSGDIYETKHEIVLVLEIPGIERSTDIRLSVFPDSITVKGAIQRRYDQQDPNFALTERFTGEFQRNFKLPARVRKQHSKATYRSGLLEIRLIKEGRVGEGDGTIIDVDFL